MLEQIREGAAHYLRADDSELGDRFLPLFLGVGAVLSAAALVGIAVDVGWHGIWDSMLHADWVFVLFVPVAVAVSHVGYAVSYREVARSEDCELTFFEALAIVATGFGPLSPRGGYTLDVQQLTKRGLPKDEAELRVRVLGMLEYAVLAPVTLVAAAYLMIQGARAQAGLLPSWAIGVPVGAVIAIAVLVKYRRDGRPSTWWAPLRENLDAIEGLIDLLRSWREAPLGLVGMVLYWAAEIAALGGCIDIFGHRRGAVAVMIVGYATGYALTRRSLPLAGAGVVEALMPFALNWVGFPLAASVLAVIAYRIFNMWLAMIPAVISRRRLEQATPPSGRQTPEVARPLVAPRG